MTIEFISYLLYSSLSLILTVASQESPQITPLGNDVLSTYTVKCSDSSYKLSTIILILKETSVIPGLKSTEYGPFS